MYSNTNTSIFICILVRINLILLLLLRILFCSFLENGKRYKVELFNVHLSFNKLYIDISQCSLKFYNLYMFEQSVNNQISRRW